MGNMQDVEETAAAVGEGCGLVLLLLFITFWAILFSGDPDLMDAITEYVRHKAFR